MSNTLFWVLFVSWCTFLMAFLGFYAYGLGIALPNSINELVKKEILACKKHYGEEYTKKAGNNICIDKEGNEKPMPSYNQ